MKNYSRISAIATAALAMGVVSVQAQECGIVDLMELHTIQPSSGTDNSVNEAMAEIAVGWASAQGEGNQKTGEALVGMGGKAGALGALVMASGGSLNAFAAAVKGLPGLISAIDESRDDPDDLYISLATEAGNDASFWPSPGEDSDLARKGTTIKMPGLFGLVPYVLGLVNDDSVAIQFWDFDTGSRDDHLGQAIFSLNDLGKGPLNTLMLSEKHGGVAYAIRYQVVPVSCDFIMADPLRNSYNSTSYSSEEGSAQYFANFLGLGYPFLLPELEAAGVAL